MPSKTTSRNVHQRFWSKVQRGSPDACWEWLGANTGGEVGRSQRHGRFRYMGAATMAHHMAWILTGKNVPPGKYLLHKCDNSLCVNPRHLYIGSRQDNVDDMRNRNREKFSSPGRMNPSAKITENDVPLILDLYWRMGYSEQAIADHFHLHQGHVSRIVLRKLWKHVPYEMPAKPVNRRYGDRIPEDKS